MRHVVEDSEPERERRDGVVNGHTDTPSQLSRFVYKPTNYSSERTSNSRLPRSRPTNFIRKDPPDYLSHSVLVQLSKCVSCGLEWTSRKTAKQKCTHIEQCAKRHALTQETVRVLVEKEINVSLPTETTLMDSIVSTSPVKKSKRQQVLPTVKSLPETRESILSRARDVLGFTNNQAHPLPTQQFGQSALARGSMQHPKRPALLDVTCRFMEEPPTQPFGTSSLRGRIITARRSADGREESSFLRSGGSLFAQDSVLSGDCLKSKRLASPPPPVDDNSRTVRRRLL